MTDKPIEKPRRGSVADPAGYYTDPTAIAADKTLSQPQKRRFLKDWQADLDKSPETDPAVEADVAAIRARVEGKAVKRSTPRPKTIPKD